MGLCSSSSLLHKIYIFKGFAKKNSLKSVQCLSIRRTFLTDMKFGDHLPEISFRFILEMQNYSNIHHTRKFGGNPTTIKKLIVCRSCLFRVKLCKYTIEHRSIFT